MTPFVPRQPYGTENGTNPGLRRRKAAITAALAASPTRNLSLRTELAGNLRGLGDARARLQSHCSAPENAPAEPQNAYESTGNRIRGTALEPKCHFLDGIRLNITRMSFALLYRNLMAPCQIQREGRRRLAEGSAPGAASLIGGTRGNGRATGTDLVCNRSKCVKVRGIDP